MRKTMLSGIHSFSEFFSNPIPYKNPTLYKETKYKGITIGNYLQVTGREKHQSFEVMTTNELNEIIADNMIPIQYDSIYFEIIIYSDNTAMLIAKYNQIIGSRWIAMIDVNTIPE